MNISALAAGIRAAQNPVLETELHRRWDSLTKPPGSLGRLEELVVQLGLMQGTADPRCSRCRVYVFCADHGVAQAGVSAYPQEVTRQMVENFASGGAAINVLCRHFNIATEIVDCGVVGDPVPGVLNRRIAPGTANLLEGPAMTAAQVEQSLNNGIELARAAARDLDLAAIGEMGIGNTTSAAALVCAYAGVPPEEAAGRGTGLDSPGLARKIQVLERALNRVRTSDPFGILAELGGFEIAAMAGFLLGAAAERLPVVVDGFIAGTAALAAVRIVPACRDYMIFSHQSAERGHARLLELLEARPLVALDMRLGEGTGAALAIGMLDAALALYNGMATLASAGVSGASEG